MSPSVRRAGADDIDAIVRLVNGAYRPLPGSAGWTHEGHLVEGPRITAELVGALLQPRSTILLLVEGPRVLACVHVKAEGDLACIGMLATDPAVQARGLGKSLLREAEGHALRHFGSRAFRMTVLSSRPELLAFYERRGYALTGETEPYPPEAGVGQPRVSGLQLLGLEKAVHPTIRSTSE